MFEMRLDRGSHTPPYLQLVEQVRHAVQMGWLSPGDQLPAVREVAGTSGVNPNTVLKAYHELAMLGLSETRAGSGTFVRATVPTSDAAAMAKYRARLQRWAQSARAAGLSRDELRSLASSVLAEDLTTLKTGTRS
jgi:GntR family transcriptional regulator